jgi:hypothetical protein
LRKEKKLIKIFLAGCHRSFFFFFRDAYPRPGFSALLSSYAALGRKLITAPISKVIDRALTLDGTVDASISGGSQQIQNNGRARSFSLALVLDA